MRLLDHLVFVAEHDDHHLAGILELRSNNGEPSLDCELRVMGSACEGGYLGYRLRKDVR
jgi:hypothetical protein